MEEVVFRLGKSLILGAFRFDFLIDSIAKSRRTLILLG